MLSTPSLPLLPAPLWLRLVVAVRISYMQQVELSDLLTVCKQMTNVKLNF